MLLTLKSREEADVLDQTAYLSHTGKYTVFAFGQNRIRFRTSDKLVRYERVKAWENGSIVVDTTYSTLGTVEEYIDLIPILEDLLIEPEKFLAPIKGVTIQYDKPS